MPGAGSDSGNLGTPLIPSIAAQAHAGPDFDHAQRRRFETHPGRGRFNAAFFDVMDGYINWDLKQRKAQVHKDLPETVVELSSGAVPSSAVGFGARRRTALAARHRLETPVQGEEASISSMAT